MRKRNSLSLILAFALSLPCGAFGADLLEVYELSLTQDPEFQSAGAANRAVQELTVQAKASLLPNVDVDIATTANRLDVRQSDNLIIGGLGVRRFNSKSFDLSLTQPLYRKDLWIQLDQARSRVRQSDIELAAARQDLMIRVATRYFDVLRAIDALRFATAEREAFGQQLKQSKQRFEVGLIAITDVEEAQAGFDLANAQVIAAENLLDTAHEALRETTGEYHPNIAGLGAEMPLAMPEPDDIDAWTQTALSQNLRLEAFRQASVTAREEIDRVEAGHLPTLDFVGSRSLSDSNGGFSGGSSSWSTALSLRLNIPIYQGGSIMSQTRQSRHLYRQALDDLERQRRATQRGARDAYLGVQSGISRVEALRQAVRSTQAAADAIEAGFQVGTRTSVDVLDAQRDLFRSKRDFADARYSYILNVLSLKQAAGTLSEDDIILVSSWLE